MTACAEVHSTVSVLRPEDRISRRVISVGITIGPPEAVKSSQCAPDPDLPFGVGVVSDVDETARCQQKCVLPSSEALAGMESMEMKDCFGPRSSPGAEGAAVPSETRYVASIASGAVSRTVFST